MFQSILQWLLLIGGGVLVLGTLLSLSRNPHWFVRGWDFPRVQIATIILTCGLLYALLVSRWSWFDWTVLLIFTVAVLWHLSVIVRYTRLWKPQVKRPESCAAGRSLRVVISNVEMQNRQFDRWQSVIRAAEPDVILALETDQTWCDVLRRMQGEYPHAVFQPQDNMYGMALLSKLELIDPDVQFILKDDYPSIHTRLRLPRGDVVELHGVHPPPPEPIRDKSSRDRDAELVIVGRDWIDPDRPVIIAGDLNDVAWSHTTRLFQRLSGMLDPRIGRGFYNTWNAKSRWFRFPLDHVFHTDDFRLVKLQRLEDVGSDHFPMLAELYYDPVRDKEQEQPREEHDDRQEAQEKIQEQVEEEEDAAG